MNKRVVNVARIFNHLAKATRNCLENCISFTTIIAAEFFLRFLLDLILPLITGICLGLQIAVIEFARNVLDWKGMFTYLLSFIDFILL